MTFLPPGERIIETKKCRISGQDFFVTNRDLEFLERISPVFQWKKFTFPTLDISPLEMRRTLLGFRNQNKLYKRKCDISGKEIVSMFSAEVPFPVYDKPLWFSDNWNPGKYGLKIDFEVPFFDQYWKLNSSVPRPSNSRVDDENSDYSNNCGFVKDCYLCFNGLFNESCYYCQIWDYSKNCVDCECIYECENSYMLSLSRKCYACFYSHELTNCSGCYISYDCIGCTNCVGCYNLRNKQNYLYNQPSTPEKIREHIEKNKSTVLSYDSMKKVISQGIHKYTATVQSENCFGNEFQSSKNCFDCYYMMNAEDCAYCDNGKEQKDCRYVMNGMKNLNNAYASLIVGIDSANIFFCINSTRNLSDVLYGAFLFNGIHHAFGCIWLHNHEHHCILNSAYSQQEYEVLSEKLADHMISTGEWWRFFSKNFSSIEYNESLAQEYFPLSRDEAKRQWWLWKEDKVISGSVHDYEPLPIEQYDERKVWYAVAQENIDDLLKNTLNCSVTKKPFRIVRQELAFYIENNIPIPREHPDQRHTKRMLLRNPRVLNELGCMQCQKTMITTYSPVSWGKIVCEDCYQKLVY